MTSDEAMKDARRVAGVLRKDVLANCLATPVSQSSEAFGPTRWLMDTGRAYDLVSAAEVPPALMEDARPTEHRIRLSTANGVTEVTKSVPLQAGPLLEVAHPLLLPSSPAVLSIGRRCMDQGYAFHWMLKRKPYLVDPNGKKVMLLVNNYVPYLSDVGDTDADSCPAKPAQQKDREDLEVHPEARGSRDPPPEPEVIDVVLDPPEAPVREQAVEDPIDLSLSKQRP
jgi:hypothetical protein